MENHAQNWVTVIMAGGIGTRFWPVSTSEKPKQFVALFDGESLLQKGHARVAGIVPDERVFVLTNRDFAHLVREQLPGVPADNVVGEPMRRDTAAAVCLGALLARRRFGNPVIFTLTADHVIEPLPVFQAALRSAAHMARETGALYTFGVRPTHPATGYGYLELGEKTGDDAGTEHFRVTCFKEKPDTGTALGYVEAGNYLWNSGLFVWTADAILTELRAHLPGHVAALEKALEHYGTGAWDDALHEAFAAIGRISIDYAVMEKARDVRCAVADFDWKDVGGWLAMQDYLDRDEAGNFSRGGLHVLDGANNLVFCEDPDETLALVGVRDLVVVRSGTRTLVAHKSRLEEVKQVVEAMEDARRARLSEPGA